MGGNFIERQKRNKQLLNIFGKLNPQDFFDTLDTIDKEKAFAKEFINSTLFTFKPDYVGAVMPNASVINALGKWTSDVFCEDISEIRGGMVPARDIRMSWPLFAQLTQTCAKHYPNTYREYADKIHRKFNINKFLGEAKKASRKSKCHKLHVGSVLVIDGEVKAKGWNFHPRNTRRDDICLRMKTQHATDISFGYCIHSEINIITRCNPRQLKNGIMFITHTPCQHCVRHLIQAQVPFVIYRIGKHPTDGPDMAWDLGGKTRFYGV